jgi:hypothetical protein
MRFDAYAGNVRGAAPEEVATMVAFACASRVERGRPRGRYHDVFEVHDLGTPVGWVAHDQALGTAYFELKGARTPESSGAIRKHWGGTGHTVSRLDACEDYDEPGSFERLVEILDSAKDPRVKSLAILPREGDRGRTINFGAPSSRVMVRVYEAGKMKERLHFGRPNWARAEAQVRPGKALEKAVAASITPLQAWGFAAWSQRAAELLAQVEVQRFAPPSEVPTFDKTTLYLARAFRRHFEVMLEDFGSWECIGRELQAVWKADDELQASQKG